MVQVDPAVGALILLVINGGVQWIREWKKHRSWRDNGGHLKDIKQKVDVLVTSASANTANITNLTNSIANLHNLGEKRFEVLGKIDRQVGAQAARCQEITDNFRGQLRNHGKKLNGLASRRRK